MASSPSRPLELHVDRRAAAAVVHVRGSVSMDEADHLRRQIELLAGEQVPVIVLDLSQMDFICSLGLGAIIAGHVRCRHHHGQIKLVAPSRPVRDLLETTRLTKLFPIYDSVEQALPQS